MTPGRGSSRRGNESVEETAGESKMARRQFSICNLQFAFCNFSAGIDAERGPRISPISADICQRSVSSLSATIRVIRGCLYLVAAAVLCLLLAGTLPAAPDSSGRKAEEEESDLQKAARTMAESIKLSSIVEGKRVELEMLEQPVLRFGDIPRANDKGSVWIWQREGRPQAIMELYRGADGQSWVHVIHSLASESIDGDSGTGAPTWSPQEAGLKWNAFAEDVQPPAERPLVRAR